MSGNIGFKEGRSRSKRVRGMVGYCRLIMVVLILVFYTFISVAGGRNATWNSQRLLIQMTNDPLNDTCSTKSTTQCTVKSRRYYEVLKYYQSQILQDRDLF